MSTSDTTGAGAGLDERAAFEAWYVDTEGSRVIARGLLERVQHGPFSGDYRDGMVQGAWNVWQAGRAALAAQGQAEPAVLDALRTAELTMREHGLVCHGGYKQVRAALLAAAPQPNGPAGEFKE